jgi:hypothetical protein
MKTKNFEIFRINIVDIFSLNKKQKTGQTNSFSSPTSNMLLPITVSQVNATSRKVTLKILTLFLLLITKFGWGQNILDNFTDGNFSASPVWTAASGSTNPAISGTSLSIGNTSGATYSISTPFNKAVSDWSIDLLSNSFSNGNLIRYYFLLKDNANPINGAADGYYIQYNSNLSDIWLFRVDNGTSTQIGYSDGTSATLSSLTTIRISRNGSNQFSVSVGGVSRISAITDATYASSTVQFQAIYLNVTSTTANHTWRVDNITYGPNTALTLWNAGIRESQDFNGIGTSGTASLPSGIKIGTATTFSDAGNTTVTTRAYGTTGTGAVTGTSSGGAINWANGVTASSADRSLGFLSASTYLSPRQIYLPIINNTGSTITALTITYDIEKYRSGSSAFDINFFSSTDGTNWTAQTSGDQNYPADANNTTINNPPTSTSKSLTITGLTFTNGSTYYVRWQYAGSGGSSNAQGLGIDNITVAVPTITGAATAAAFTTTYGTASTAQSFSVSGGELSANLVATAQTGFEVATTENGTYQSSVSFTPSSGSASGTVWVRLKSDAAVSGTYNSTTAVALTSTGATTVNITTSSSNNSVTAKSLTIGAPTIASKVYDGTTTAGAVTVGTLSGFVGTQTVTATATAANYSSKNVGSYASTVITYTLADGTNGGLATNYSLANGSATGSITAKPLTIGEPSIASKTYDGTATAGAVTVGSLSGFVSSETVTATGTAAAYSSANAGSYTTTVSYTLADGTNGGLATNYSLANTTGVSGTITKANAVINSAPTASDISLGQELSNSSLSGGSATPSGGTFTFTSPSTVPASTGSYSADITYTPAVADQGNYNNATGTTSVQVNAAGSPTLNAATLTSALTSTYGTASTGVSFTASGSNLTADITVTPQTGYEVSTTDATSGFGSSAISVTNSATVWVRFAATRAAGTYNNATAVVLSGGGASSSANISTSSSGNVVSAKGLTITGIGISDKTYDGSNAATITGTVAYSGLENGESFSVTGSPSATFSDKNVANNKTVTVSGYTAPNSNYSISQPTGLTANITAKALSVTAPTIASRAYNGTTTAGAVTVGTLSGFVGTETVTATGTAASYSSANVGTYAGVTVTYNLADGTNGGLAINYSLAAGSASGTITAKSLTIGAPSIASKVYDGTTTAGAVTVGSLSGLVGSETLMVSGAAANYSSANVGSYTSTVITYTLGDGTNGGLASNYSLANGSATGAITAKPLSITTATIADKVYNASATSGTVTPGTLTGFVGTETVTVASATGTYADANAGTGKTATITYTLANGANGGLATNYSLASTTATGNINKANQTITFGVLASKTTADAPYSISATSTSGLTVSFSSANTAVATVAGSTVTIVGAGTSTITASQAGDQNYNTATSVDQTLTVTPAVVTIVAWQFGSPESAGNETTYNSTTTNSNLNTSTLSRGAGVSFSSLPRGFGSTGYTLNGTKANAISNNDFITFTVSSKQGYKVSLRTLDATVRRSSSGPNIYRWSYSLDGTAFTDCGPNDVSFTSTATEGVQQATIDLSSITALQNIPVTSTVTFRLYSWGAPNTGGTFGIGRTPALTTTHALAIGGFVEVDNSPAITTSAASVSGLTYTQGSGPSSASSVTLSAINLTGGGGTITINGSTNFEVSTTSSSSGFGSSATLAYTGTGTLAANTVWIRLKAGLSAGTYSSETISISGGGATASITASGSVATPPPVNDLCANASTALIGNTSGTTMSSSISSPFSSATDSDVWYVFTPTCSTTYTVSTTQTSQDIDIEVYSGSCPAAASGNIETGGGATSLTSESATFSATAGTTYYIRLLYFAATSNSVKGSFTLTITDPFVAQAVTSSAATLVSGQAATLNGSLTTIGVCPSTTEKGFVYSITSVNNNPTEGGTGVTKVSVASITTGAYSTLLTSLTPSTGYSYKAYVYDGTTYTYGATQTFTTTAAANWDFGFVAPGTASATYNQYSNITLGDISTGNSLGSTTLVTNTSPSSNTGASAFYNAATVAPAGALNTSTSAYFQFTVTPSAGYVFRLSAISFGSRSTSSGPVSYTLRSSLDNYAAQIAGGTMSNTSVWESESNTGLNVVSSNGTPITFRIYGFGSSGSPTSGSANWRIDDLTLTLSEFTPGVINTTGQTICSGGTPSEIGSSTDASGGGGSIGYTWRSSADGYTNAIAGATSSTYTPPSGLTSTTSYRRYATSSSFSTPVVSSGTWAVTVNSLPDAPTAGNNSRCGTGTVALSVSGAGGTYKWYSDEALTTQVATGSSYTTSSISTSTNYYVTETNISNCSSPVTLVTATINEIPSAPTTSSQTYCFGSTVSNLVATGDGIKWYDAATNGNLLAGSTTLSTGTYYASQTVLGCESSRTSVAVTVNATGTWIGGVSGNWNVSGNWCGGIPDSNTSVTIPSGTTINIDASSSVLNLTIGSGATLNFSGSHTLTIGEGGSFTNNGTFNAGSSKVIFLGTGLSTYSGETDFYDIEVQTGASLVLQANCILKIGHTLVNSGLIDASSNQNTIVYNGSNQSVALLNGDYGNLTLSGTGTKTFAHATATKIRGNFVVDAVTLTAPDQLTFNGVTAQNIAGIAYSNVHFEGAGTKTFISNASIKSDKAITFASGTGTIDFDGPLNDKVFTFKSDAIGTARVGVVPNGVTLEGKVKVERFIPRGKRAFRFLTPGVTTTNSILANWQNGGDYAPGVGTHITGSSSASGFDATTLGNPSMFSYNNQVASGSGWTQIPNTNGTNLQAGMGYRILIRGDRTSTLITAAAQPEMNVATTLSATGTLTTGTVTYNSGTTPAINTTNNSTTNGYSLIGNPYVSPIDWHAVELNNILDTYYTWDPNMGNPSQRGRYVAYTITDANTGVTSVPTSQVNRFIQPGQAFFVKTSDRTQNPSITFNESNKASTFRNVFREETPVYTKLNISLFEPAELGIGGYALDGVVALYGDSFSNTIGLGDVPKMEAGGENLAIFGNNLKLAMQGSSPIQNNDELLLKTLRLVANKNYTFKINAVNFDASVTAYLVDNFLATTTPINLTQDYFGNFSTTSVVASYSEDRFKIVFQVGTLATPDFESSISLYPNPSTTNAFYLNIANWTDDIKIRLHNAVGQEIPLTIESSDGLVRYCKSKIDLAAGVYIISISKEGIMTSKKWIIQR